MAVEAAVVEPPSFSLLSAPLVLCFGLAVPGFHIAVMSIWDLVQCNGCIGA